MADSNAAHVSTRKPASGPGSCIPHSRSGSSTTVISSGDRDDSTTISFGWYAMHARWVASECADWWNARIVSERSGATSWTMVRWKGRADEWFCGGQERKLKCGTVGGEGADVTVD
jgi:hypothetical protein